MAKYRKHPWQEYFNAFEQANLTQTEFCKQHDLNPKYFSQKLSQHKMRNGAFNKVSFEPSPSVLTRLMLEVGNCKVDCPDSMLISSFISLVKYSHDALE